MDSTSAAGRWAVGLDLVEWVRAEAPERRVYVRPPLALALCQIRFSTRFGLGDAGVAPFQEAIEEEYPNPDRQQEVATIQVGGGAGQLGMQTQAPSTLWKFTDDTGDWTVTLTQDFVALETRAYADFDDFLARLRRVLQALVRTVRPGVGRRIGLRYINEIRSAEPDWSSVIRGELLGVLAFEPFRSHCDQSMQVLSLRAGEARINLQHGWFPKGTTVVPKPGTPADDQPFYLLDVDMFREFPPPKSLKMDASVISGYVEGYHATVSELFRWATTDEYRASLGERNHAR
jgi:uncharacterized protein (TIGR04255 family)